MKDYKLRDLRGDCFPFLESWKFVLKKKKKSEKKRMARRTQMHREKDTEGRVCGNLAF